MSEQLRKITGGDADIPWYADTVGLVEWWADPALAYAKGLEDGARLAQEQADADLNASLIQIFGGGKDRREAIERLLDGLGRDWVRKAGYSVVRGRP